MNDKDKRIKELELMLFDSDLHLEAAIEEINRLKAILKDVRLTAEWYIEDCAWCTEEEIKQVVAALRSVFKGV